MQRLQGLDDLRRLLEQPNSQLDREQLCDLVDIATELLRDNNHKVVQGILQVLSLIVIAASEPVKPHMNTLLPLVVERLGESRQAVRGSAFNLLLDMFNCIKPAYMLEKIARYWTHRAWKVRHGIIQTITQLVVDNNTPLLGTPEQSEYIINQVVNLVEDPESNVRTVVYECLKELWVVLDNVLLDNLKKQNIRPAVFKEVLTYLDEARPTNYTLPDNPAPPSTAAVTKRSVSRSSETNTATSAAPSLASQPSASKKAGARDLSVAASSPQEPAEPTPIYVTSDKELAAELDAMVTPLNGTVVDWQQRISHMQRLEGLALGCVPGMLEPLNECLKGLRDSMSKQLEDRRSAVEKQACMTLGLLSAVLGIRFQEHLVYYLPVLFKILPITVQVMAEAADTCVKTLLANCQSHRAIPVLAQTAIKDKNARIRHGCASYLADLLGSWEPQVLLRCSDDLEAAMKSAVSDASGEARAAARRMYAGYAAIAPDVAQAFLRKLDPSVQDKLCKAASSTVPCKRALLPKPFLSRPSSSTSLASSTADSDIIIVAPHPPAPSQLGGSDSSRVMSNPARRSSVNAFTASGLQPRAANKPWNVKVELLAAMTDSLGTAAGMTDGSEAAHLDPSRDIEKAALKLLECLEDPHYKVALAVLELLRAVVQLHPTALDSSAERLLSALFSRQQDQKDAVRACVTDVLKEMASHYSAEVLLTGLIRALESNKQPKSKLSILEYGAAHIGRQCPAGIPSTNSTLLKQWLSRLAPLLTDKSVELRKRATEAVEAAQIHVDAQAVHSFAQFCSGAEGIALRRVLSSLDARYRNDSQPAAPDTPGAAPAPATQQKPQPLAVSPNAVTATVGPRAAYTASDYMTPYKADPAKVACIGPLADPAPPKTSLPTVRTVSDPGELLPARDQGLLLVAGPTSSISAAGSTQPPSLLSHLGGAGGAGGTGAAAVVAAGGSAGEPGAQVRMLSLLTHRLSSHVTHETMAQLIDAVGKYCTAAWEAGFPALLAVLTSKAIASSDAGIREMVMVLIEKLSAQHGVLVQPTPAIDALMQCVLTALQDTSKEVELAAADALRTLVLAAPAKQLLDVLAALLPSSLSPEMQAGGDRLCALCRALQRVFKSKAAPAMLARLQADLLPGLLLCADHQRVDVRKAAVFALAQAWHSIGDERFAVVVPSLSQSHGHLVRWAVGKLRAADKSGSDVMSCQ
ncbi:uncharacterized protein HaLaN_02944, partial [Haematococcus lacustris]